MGEITTHGQRLLSKEVDERFVLKIDNSIKRDGVNGIMTFGELNDYPQLMEKLINSSTTAKAVSRVYSKFLTGLGFENEALNNIVIGKDSRSKDITLKGLLRQVSDSISYHNGFYLHCNMNVNGQINKVHLKPFKDARFAKPDDTGYSAKICIYDNWTKESLTKKYDKSKVSEYPVFNISETALTEQIRAAGGIEKFKGQIYFQFLDDKYFYPLSNFDSVYLDCDTEAQIALYKNRQLRDGFFDQIVVRVTTSGTDEEKEEFAEGLKKKLGPNGEKVTIIEADVDENGNIRENGDFKIDKLESNVNDKLFSNWEKGLANNIRKDGGKGVPALLIDYEENKLGTTSGEAIVQATNFYNAITNDDRTLIENSFKEIFSNSIIPELKNNTNWKIKPLQILQNGTIDNNGAANV